MILFIANPSCQSGAGEGNKKPRELGSSRGLWLGLRRSDRPCKPGSRLVYFIGIKPKGLNFPRKAAFAAVILIKITYFVTRMQVCLLGFENSAAPDSSTCAGVHSRVAIRNLKITSFPCVDAHRNCHFAVGVCCRLFHVL